MLALTTVVAALDKACVISPAAGVCMDYIFETAAVENNLASYCHLMVCLLLLLNHTLGGHATKTVVVEPS